MAQDYSKLFFILLILILCQFLIAKDIGQVNFRYFIFSQNLYQPHPLFFPEAWSLSIEEWFYLTFPNFNLFIIQKVKKQK